MKKYWFLFLLFISCASLGQIPVKIYAYSQVIYPGTIPKNVKDEDGKPVNTKKEPAINYYIYAVYSRSARIVFEEVWINGKYYKVQTGSIDSTPVVHINSNIPGNPKKDILVPATRLRVISLILVDHTIDIKTRSAKVRKMVKDSALIVSYLYKGKRYFTGIKKIKILQPLAGI